MNRVQCATTCSITVAAALTANSTDSGEPDKRACSGWIGFKRIDRLLSEHDVILYGRSTKCHKLLYN